MSIKTILAPLTNSPQARTTLETAFIVAQHFGSHVVGLAARPALTEDNVDLIMEVASLGKANPLLQEVNPVSLKDEHVQKVGQLFRDICREMNVKIVENPRHLEKVSAAFKVVIGDGPEVTAEAARVFDLVVAGQPKNDPGYGLREILRAVLFHSGRPVLIAPERATSSVGQSILISWNRSKLSARAAAISRQYFERATRVGILSVDAEQAKGPSAADLLEYLAWHGVEAELLEAKCGHHRLGEIMLEQATTFGADLSVMGAYSQSPFRESLTRGVTNYVLSHTEIPVLMTH